MVVVADLIIVDAHNLFGVADSSDPGDDPDLLAAVGTVVFTSSLGAPTTMLSTQSILSFGQVVCIIDEAGNLRPPLDGALAPPYDVAGELKLICPRSTDLLDRNWTWQAEFRPAQGQTWRGFTIKGITGDPGETIVLTTKLPTTVAPAVRQATVFFVDDFDPAAPVVPDGFTAGADLIWRTSDNTIFEG